MGESTETVKRPRSVSVISWLLIIVGLYGVASSVMRLLDPQVREVLKNMDGASLAFFFLVFVARLISALCGLLMLHAVNLGRLAVFLIFPVVLLATLVWLFATHAPWFAFAFMVLPPALFAAVCFYFLTRDEARIYFQPEAILEQ